MATVPLLTGEGQANGMVEVRASVAESPINVAVMHQALVRQRANGRQGTHDTLTRGEVRGGGRKPHRQKGTGRARQGSIRAPHYRGGGTVFGPTPHGYDQRMPRKQRRLALRSAVAAAIADGRLRVVEGLTFETPKTARMAAFLRTVEAGRRVLLITAQANLPLERSCRNIPELQLLRAVNLNVHDLLSAETVLVTRDAMEQVEGHLG